MGNPLGTMTGPQVDMEKTRIKAEAVGMVEADWSNLFNYVQH